MVTRKDENGLFMLCTAKGHKGESTYLQDSEKICQKCQMRELRSQNEMLQKGLQKAKAFISDMHLESECDMSVNSPCLACRGADQIYDVLLEARNLAKEKK